MANPFVPSQTPLTDTQSGAVTDPWLRFFQNVAALLAQIQTAIAAVPGTKADVLANAPTGLTSSDAGLLFFCTDYGHLLRWDGSAWHFGPGDVGNGFVRQFPSGQVPQEASWWQQCSGAAIDYLVISGGVLTRGTVRTPVLPNFYFRR